MSSTHQVSVVIPTFNRCYALQKAIDSVLAQSIVPMEIIVVDDGSTDDTPSSIASYGNRIRYLRQENAGVSAARNRGVANATSQWIAFLDDDDEYVPEKLETQMEELGRADGAIAHVGNVAFERSGHAETDLFTIRGIRPEETQEPTDDPLAFVLRGGFFIQCMVVRRDVLVEAGGFREDIFYEDLDACIRLALCGRWKLSHKRLVRVIRRDDDGGNLSAAGCKDPVKA